MFNANHSQLETPNNYPPLQRSKDGHSPEPSGHPDESTGHPDAGLPQDLRQSSQPDKWLYMLVCEPQTESRWPL